MDFWKALHELHAERHRLNQVIATLEAMRKGEPPPLGRRGRKGMSQEERQLVSERMRSWWATRRNGRGGGED